MTDRIKKLCSYLTKCKTFADVGCDHGYCTLFALKNSLCEKAVISDVSQKCLSKAERLLKNFMAEGKCTSVCCFGLEKIDPSTELTLIAGMGGEEITQILKSAYIPENFVLQPMKNVKEVREFLLNGGAEITRDDVFLSGGKFYFVLAGKRRGQKSVYTRAQLTYGKGDLKGDLGVFLRQELAKKLACLERAEGEDSRKRILNDITVIGEAMKGETE